MRRIKRTRRNKKENILSLATKRFTDSLYHHAVASATGRSLIDFEGEKKTVENSFFYRLLKGIIGKFDTKKIKYKIQKKVENSLIIDILEKFINMIMTAMIRQYGIFVFSFGLYTVLVYFIGTYAITELNVSSLHLIVGLAEIMCSVPMLVSRKTLSQGLCESIFTDVILFRMLGISIERIERVREKAAINSGLPFVLGLLAGVATTFVSPVTLLLIVLLVLLMYLTLISPESTLILVVAFLPFLSQNLLSAVVIYILFCYAVKVLRSKRSFRLELTDYAVLAFVVVTLVGSICSVNPLISSRYSAIVVTYACIYFMIVNTIKTRSWIFRSIGAVIFSLVSATLCGLLQKFVSGVGFILSEDLIIDGVVRAAFSAPIVLAQFILLFVFYLFSMTLSTDVGLIRKLFLLILSAVSVICLYYTQTPMALCAFIVGTIVFFMLYSRRTIIFGILLSIAMFLVRYILPSIVKNGIHEYLSLIKETLIFRIEVWKSSVNMFFDHVLGGSGSGTYSYLYGQYMPEGAEEISSAYNIYFQTAIELGIIGILVFILLVYLFIKCNLSLFAKHGAGANNIYSCAGFAGVISVLVLGFTENIWQTPQSVLMFWIAVGLCMAIKRYKIFIQRGYEEYLLGDK